MRRVAVLIVLHAFLIAGLVIANFIAPAQIRVAGIVSRKEVFIMFGFGLGVLWSLAVYDVYAAFGAFRRRRDLEKTIDRLEGEILSSKGPPSRER